MLFEITLVETEAQPAAVIRLTCPREEIQQVMSPAIEEVLAAVSTQGIGPVGPLFAHHFGMQPGIFNFEVGFPVSAPVTPAGRVKAGEIPGGKVLRTIYTGPYEGLGDAWGEFKDKIASTQHTEAPNLWERYLTGPESSPDPATWQTELNQPLIN